MDICHWCIRSYQVALSGSVFPSSRRGPGYSFSEMPLDPSVHFMAGTKLFMVTNISSPGRQVAYIESFCLETSSPDHDGPSDLLYNELKAKQHSLCRLCRQNCSDTISLCRWNLERRRCHEVTCRPVTWYASSNNRQFNLIAAMSTRSLTGTMEMLRALLVLHHLCKPCNQSVARLLNTMVPLPGLVLLAHASSRISIRSL